MKANIKNTLIGVLVLSFFGLLYAFLGSKPEMVANNNLRVEESPLQSPGSAIQHASFVEAEIELAPNVNDEVQAEETDLADTAKPVEVVESYTEVEAAEYVKPSQSPETVVVLDPETEQQIDIAETESLESVSTLSTTDVVIIDSSDDFLNLNLVEEQPVSMVLVEGDQLILDDVNEGLSQFKSIVVTGSGEVVDESMVVDTNTAVFEKSDQDQLVVLSIVMPDADQELMAGTDKVSREYQDSMGKLLKVQQQMMVANAENEKLKVKFSSVVNQNRELAILIRDIDIKIKTLTASN